MAQGESTLDVAILGAGIGGLALAIGLAERGIPFIVYEAANEFSPVGAGIGLGPNSLEAIDILDPRFRSLYEDAKTENERPKFEHSVFDALYAEEGLDFGAKLGWNRGLVGAPYFSRSSAHRKDLLNIMMSFIPEGKVKFGKRAKEIESIGHKARVVFEDGETILVDLLIGCDGIKGMSRRAVLKQFAPDELQAQYCNMYIYRGILPMTDVKEILGDHGGDAKWFMSKGKSLAIYPISKGREENFVFFIHDPKPWEGAQEVRETSHEAMRSDLATLDARLLRLLDWAKPLKWPIFHHPSTPTYYNGRICMLGDVAHASSPGQAAGAGQGLEDAAVLSHLLAITRSTDQIPRLLEVYDSIRRPRAQRVVQTSQEAGEMYVWNSPETESDMQKIVDNANNRLHWIWQHDLRADVQLAEDLFHNKTEV